MGILGPPYCGIGATIRIGREMLCLPYAGFLKEGNVFFLQIRPHWLLTTKSSILMYSAGIEPVTLVTAKLRSNCSPIEQTDIPCGKMPIHTTFFGGGGGGGENDPF